MLSSDVDSAVAFDDAVPRGRIGAYRAAFGEVYGVLARAGLSGDDHGATAQHALFARTNAEWRAAGEQWLAAPAEHNGAMMTSLLVDGRPIHGDPGLPAVTRVFGDLRGHPGTMRLLLLESLARRAKLRSVVAWRAAPDTFDIKAHALLPVVNLARWAALSVGSAVLPTTERLRAASGSAMLPDEQARTLIEVFEVLQRLRLRYQLRQYQAGERPSDVLVLDRLSPIDRSVIAQAVREIAAVQRRMDNVSHYVAVEEWASPEPDLTPSPPVTAAGAISALRRRRASAGRDRVARRRDGGLQVARPRPVGHVLLQRGVDLVLQRGVALLDADAVGLVGEALADDLEPALVLRIGGVAGEDHVVRGHRVDLAGGQGRDAVGVPRELLEVDASLVEPQHVVRRGRPGHRAEVLAVQRLRSGDLVFVTPDQQVLVGEEVGPGEVDGLLALIGDRVGREDQVHLAAAQHGLALGPGRTPSR